MRLDQISAALHHTLQWRHCLDGVALREQQAAELESHIRCANATADRFEEESFGVIEPTSLGERAGRLGQWHDLLGQQLSRADQGLARLVATSELP